MSLRESHARASRRPRLADSSESAARVAAAAGLFSSWASPAARVPRVMSELCSRAVDSIERAVWYSPPIRWAPNGNHAANSSRSDSAGRRKTRPGRLPRPVAR